MAINISHPTNTIEGLDILNINSGNSANIELNPDSGLVNVNGNINITGNFTVQGTTTTVNSTTATLVDPIILLGTDPDGNPVTAIENKDRGISFYYNDGAGNKTGFFGYDRGTGKFRFVPDATITSEVVSGDDGTIKVDTVEVNTVTSSVTGDIVLDPAGNDIDVTNSVIKNLLDPTNNQDAATKNYVDSTISSITNLNIDADTGSGIINLASNTLTINGTTHQISTQISGDVLTISLPLNLIVPGSLEVTSNLQVDGDTTLTGTTTASTVNATSLNVSGNTTVNGNLDVDTNLEVTGTTNLIGATTVTTLNATQINTSTVIAVSDVQVGGVLSVAGNTDISGSLNVDGNIILGGNITIGDQQIDTVNVVADFTSNLIPQVDATYNLGSATKRWNDTYTDTLNSTAINTTTLEAGDLNIATNVISSDTSGDIIIDSGTDNIELVGNTNVTGNLDVTGNITLGGNITIGDQQIDTVNVVADFTSNLVPQTDATYNLGSATKRWNNVYANTINADLVGNITGNVTGQVSDISNHTTTALAEGTNLYYTDARARLAVSAIDAGGDGSFSYNNITGTFTYTGPSAAEARAHFSAGTGVYYDNLTGVISIGQSVDTTSNVTFNSVTVTTNTTTTTLDAGDLNIATNVISSDVSGDIVIDSGVDNIELIGNTNVTGNFTVANDTVIYGNLTVQGTTTSVESTNTEISDNTITLNKGEVGAGISSGTSGIEVDRGSLDDASWKYSESTNSWEAREGSSLAAITSSEIDAGNVNISGNTVSVTSPNSDLNLNSSGTGQVKINGRQVATDTDALMYAIVFGG